MASTSKSTAQKYEQLNGNNSTPWAISGTDATSKQLIYPLGFGNSADHSGLAMVFEFNTITPGKTTPYENTLTGIASTVTKSRDRSGLYQDNVETSLTRDGGRSTLRNNSTSLGGLKSTYKKTEISVVLPPPEGFTDSLDLQWQDVEMGGIGRAGDFINSLSKGDAEALKKQMGATSIDVISKLSTGLGGPDIKNWAQMVTGLTQNNYNEAVFSQVGNRSFNFKWTFVPRNEKEAAVINAIIHRFRWASLPELFDETGSNASFFRAPWTFDLQLVDINTGVESTNYPKIGTCALTKIDVDRAPKGDFTVVGDEHQPLSTTISLQFRELFILNKSMLENGYTNSY